MEMTKELNRVVLLVALVGALVLGSLPLAVDGFTASTRSASREAGFNHAVRLNLAGVGTSPSNNPARVTLQNGVAFTISGINGESTDDRHQNEIQLEKW